MNSKLIKSITQLFLASVILAFMGIVVSQWLDRRYGPVAPLEDSSSISTSQFDEETQRRIDAEKRRQKYEQRVNIHLWKLWEQLEMEHQLELQQEKANPGNSGKQAELTPSP